MTKRRWLLITPLFIALFPTIRAGAQSGADAQSLASPSNFMSLTTFELSAPLGDTKRYMTGGVGPGLGWEGRWAVNAHSSAGVSLTVPPGSRPPHRIHDQLPVRRRDGRSTASADARATARGRLPLPVPAERRALGHAGGGIRRRARRPGLPTSERISSPAARGTSCSRRRSAPRCAAERTTCSSACSACGTTHQSRRATTSAAARASFSI